jgi:syndecan 4
VVPVQLLELGELSNLLDEKQVKQFVMELSNPRQGAKLGVYPTTTVTILDEPGELFLVMVQRFFNFSAT